MATCTGKIRINIDHSHGGWSSDCEVRFEMECSEVRCYWHPPEALEGRTTLTLEDVTQAQAHHDRYAAEAGSS